MWQVRNCSKFVSNSESRDSLVMLFQVIPLQVTNIHYAYEQDDFDASKPPSKRRRQGQGRRRGGGEEEEKDRARDATRLEPLVRFFYSLFSVLIITFLSRLRSTPALELPSLLPLPPSSPSPASSSPPPSAAAAAASTSTSPGPETRRVSGPLFFFLFFFGTFFLHIFLYILLIISWRYYER